MSSVYELQNDFQLFLTGNHNAIKHSILSTSTVSADTRLAIYKESYISRLEDALASNYPVLQKWLGDELFQTLHLAYLQHHPSTFYSIRWYGDQLANFIKSENMFENGDFLAEMAQWEWAMATAFDASDAPLLTIEDIATLAPDEWENLKLTAHASVQCLTLSWNIPTLCEEIAEDKPLSEPEKQEIATTWIIWRSNLITYYQYLSDDQAFAIDCVLKKLTFGAICNGLCEWRNEDEVGLHAATLLKSWIQTGLLIKDNEREMT